MPEFKIVEIFKHRRRICVVIAASLSKSMNFHNGYVSMLSKNSGRDYSEFYGKNLPEEPTFSGDLDFYRKSEIPLGTWFMGFDTAHIWDTSTTQSLDAVIQRTKDLADVMIELKI